MFKEYKQHLEKCDATVMNSYLIFIVLQSLQLNRPFFKKRSGSISKYSVMLLKLTLKVRLPCRERT